MFRVRLACAMPMILLGIRLAAIQVIATATIAAYVGLGGLGRYVFDGLARRELDVVIAGSVLIALLAVLTEGLLILIAKFGVSPGLSQRSRTN